jgi:DNA polymerase III subunit gamma/tau
VSRALYRKYRSKSLDEIVGQDHVTNVLKRSLAQGKIAHAYLLTGPKGVGKTSIARILAYEINKLPYNEDTTNLDIIEIDAASNNGVEDVRDLREKVQIAPVSASKKIYIIDEVHMLSKAAFNALLKTLEEPPEHAVFILATTDADKLPATIISRTQQFTFRAISINDAKTHLRTIADAEKIKIDDDALNIIAARGDGSFRDSISLLDQLSSIADAKKAITSELVEQALGLASHTVVTQLLDAYEAKDLKAIVTLLDESENSGVQSSVLTSQLITAVRHNLSQKPQFISLLDQLLEVSKSSQPAVKLLTILAAHAAPKPKIAALSAPAMEVSAPIAELERQATKKKPAMPRETALADDVTTGSQIKSGMTATTSTPAEEPARPATSVSSRSATISSEYLQPETDQTPGLLSVPERSHSEEIGGRKGERNNTNVNTNDWTLDQVQSDGDKKSEGNLTALDWPALVEYCRQHFIAIHSVLSKCSYIVQGEKLVIYTGNAFYKKKLDDSKHRINLSKALVETGVGDVLIETIGTPPPPKDETAAAVAAIMGGGEEVSISE